MRSIIFNTEMVQAILDGRKTVTRRIIRPQPEMRLCYCMGGYNAGKWNYPSPQAYKYWGDEWRLSDDIARGDLSKAWTPPCHTDDILYVRETWCRHGNPKAGIPMHYDYRADRPDPIYNDSGFIATWRPSIHMPKEAARIFLKVTNMSVEKLHSMPLSDVPQEGILTNCESCPNKGSACCEKSVVEGKLDRLPCAVSFRRLWDSTLKKDDIPLYGWNADPYVWVIDFKRISRKEACS